MSDTKKQILENFGRMLDDVGEEEKAYFLSYSEGAAAVAAAAKAAAKPQEEPQVAAG